jgi:1-acyl-sn-glycerol-3-phosphate acyltransferase
MGNLSAQYPRRVGKPQLLTGATMIFTILWVIFFMLFMLLCFFPWVVLMMIKPFTPKRKYYKIVIWFGSWWGRVVFRTTGSKVTITGKENLPSGGAICIIANHQSIFDVPVLMGFVGMSMGFIAKKELFKFPVLSYWMKELHCIFIDRQSARSAVQSFAKGAETIKSGYPIAIFPEGTRAQSDNIAKFQVGSIKLATMAGATIVPIVVSGTWHIYEENKRIKPTHIQIRILPVVGPEDEVYSEKQLLMDTIRDRIVSAQREILQQS